MTAPHEPIPALADLVSLAGRSALVTGAGRGIGEAIARRLAEAGAAVYLGDLDGNAARGVARDIGGAAVGGELDVSDPDSVASAVAAARSAIGDVGILVNNAGIYPPMPFGELDLAAWRRVHAVNVDGAFLCARAVAGTMAKAGRGVIINLTSTTAIRPMTAGLAAYATSKSAIEGLTRTLAVEFGSAGIRAVSVCPTLVATPGLAALSASADVSGAAGEIDKLIPLGRLGLPDDVARVVVFCASDLAGFVTGSTILVDGGAMVS